MTVCVEIFFFFQWYAKLQADQLQSLPSHSKQRPSKLSNQKYSTRKEICIVLQSVTLDRGLLSCTRSTNAAPVVHVHQCTSSFPYTRPFPMLDHNFVSKLETKEMKYSVQIEFIMCSKLHVSHQCATNLDTVMHYSNT